MPPIFNSINNNNPIQDDGSGKVSQMKEKLCAKRLMLEKTLEQNPSDDAREELMLLKTSMKTFGISEIDYVAYTAKQGATQP
jgi:hypothetical protein